MHSTDEVIRREAKMKKNCHLQLKGREQSWCGGGLSRYVNLYGTQFIPCPYVIPLYVFFSSVVGIVQLKGTVHCTVYR